jgi:hypothetical protein
MKCGKNVWNTPFGTVLGQRLLSDIVVESKGAFAARIQVVFDKAQNSRGETSHDSSPYFAKPDNHGKGSNSMHTFGGKNMPQYMGNST